MRDKSLTKVKAYNIYCSSLQSNYLTAEGFWVGEIRSDESN